MLAEGTAVARYAPTLLLQLEAELQETWMAAQHGAELKDMLEAKLRANVRRLRSSDEDPLIFDAGFGLEEAMKQTNKQVVLLASRVQVALVCGRHA